MKNFVVPHSVNVKKTKYTFFHKNSIKDDIPLKLPALKIANREIERTNAIKFLGILLDENISWKNHIRSVEKKHWPFISCQILT